MACSREMEKLYYQKLLNACCAIARGTLSDALSHDLAHDTNCWNDFFLSQPISICSQLVFRRYRWWVYFENKQTIRCNDTTYTVKSGRGQPDSTLKKEFLETRFLFVLSFLALSALFCYKTASYHYIDLRANDLSAEVYWPSRRLRSSLYLSE